MSDALKSLVEGVGHASQIINRSDKPWQKAGAGSPQVNWHFLAQLQQEADAIEEHIWELVEADPWGAAQSDMGRIHLHKWGFLCSETSEYPYKFQVEDVILEAPWIAAQLVADEYYMDGKESTPFTPEAFINADLTSRNVSPRKIWIDPFLAKPEDRGDVTVEAKCADKDKYVYNDNPILPVKPKPEWGFVYAH